MKNTPVSILACACLVLAAFLGGIYWGRNMSGDNIQTSLLSASSSIQENEPASSSVATSATVSQSGGKVNINTADLLTLMTLDGIGETYAQRIIDYRVANGPFTNIADIMKVEGIGTKRFESIKDHITTGG